MLRQYELVDLVKSYNPSVDEGLLDRAYVFTTKVHGLQKRHSGDPYFSHPIEVAGILTKLKLDTATIITGLLHDTIEDTDTTFEDLSKLFGEEIAVLVDGVTKLSNIHLSTRTEKQADNFRKFFLATAKDVRVLLVKLADRLHNMRTLHHIPTPEKRKRIAEETLDIYAPLANRIGIQTFRDELEDLAFKELNPNAREDILCRVDDLRESTSERIELIREQIEEALAEHDLKAVVKGRMKRPYSIWRKMERKALSFERFHSLSDIVGFRLIMEKPEQCYAAMGILHSKWNFVPGRFKDYISTPKRNGYQSIHTTIAGPNGQQVEVQIRTKEMHEVAEAGVAAHWQYKEQNYSGVDVKRHSHSSGAVLRQALFDDLKSLADLLDEEESSEEFLEHTKMEMYSDSVFAFSPKGDLITLPRQASALDFAYAVHTSIGDSCVGAKINGRHRPISSVLRNGDVVEILVSTAQHPTPDWERMVVTGRAKSAIRRNVRELRNREFIELGSKQFLNLLERNQIKPTKKLVKAMSKHFNVSEANDLYLRLGAGKVSDADLIKFLESYQKTSKNKPKRLRTDLNPKMDPSSVSGKGANKSLPLLGLKPGLAVHFAPCCHPLPGDQIIGVKLLGRGVMVHRRDCELLDKFDSEWFDVRWDESLEDELKSVGRIIVIVQNEPGVLGQAASIIAQHEANITNLRFINQDDFFAEIAIDIVVNSVDHLAKIIESLSGIEAVNAIRRAESSDFANNGEQFEMVGQA